MVTALYYTDINALILSYFSRLLILCTNCLIIILYNNNDLRLILEHPTA